MQYQKTFDKIYVIIKYNNGVILYQAYVLDQQGYTS